MKVNAQKIKQLLFGMVLLCMFVPLMQSYWRFIDVGALKGDVSIAENTTFSVQSFATGEYQKKKELYFKSNFGFQPYFVRLNNEIQYDVFGNINARGVVFGRDGYLYEENYIKACLGMDFIGEDSISNQVQRLELITDSLQSRGVHLVVLLAPGKGSFFPDFFPRKYKDIIPSTTNLETYRAKFKDSRVNVIDAAQWLHSLKSTVHKEHKLFSKTGIHWSRYSEYLVSDSLMKYVSSVTGNVLPTMRLDSIISDNKMRYTDDDILRGMNLLFPRPDFKMSYPMTTRLNRERNTTKVLTVGDSYYWGIYNERISREYFGNGEFWYYFKSIYPLQNGVIENVADQDVLARAEKHKVILIVCTDANLNRLGFGFIETFSSIFEAKNQP